MLYNYLKITWRTLKKYSAFSAINIIGLAASLSFCLLIMLFLIDQRSADRFHENSDRIVRVVSDFKSPSNDDHSLYATSPATLGSLLADQFPEVERSIKIRGNFDGEFRGNEKTIPLRGIYANEEFFSVFDFELSQGNPETALLNPGSVVITRETADKFFDEPDVVGKRLTLLGGREFTVTGVIDKTYRTHIAFDIIGSHATLSSNPEAEQVLANWQNSIYDSYTYLLLREGTSFDDFEARIQPLIGENYVDPAERSKIFRLVVQPITSINLGPDISNEIGMVIPAIIAWFLTGFTVIIVLIAIFNYVSLTIARALNRGKEVGVRKVLGSDRAGIIKQFIFESVLIAVTALLFAGVMLRWLLPEFNGLYFISFTGNQVESELLFNYGTILSFIGFAIAVGVLAGIYPSLYLSRFNPALILKGTFNVTGLSGQLLKKIITVTQFTFSIIFIVTSVIMVKQFEHMTTSDYGFERENIVHIRLQDVPYNQLREIVKNNTNIHIASLTSTVPALGSSRGVQLRTGAVERLVRGHRFSVDENYLETMGIDLIAGRNFNPEMATDSSQAVILSDFAVRQLGFRSPEEALDQVIQTNRDREVTIIGVIKGFVTADPMNLGGTIALFFAPDEAEYVIAKVRPGQTVDFINNLEAKWNELGSLHSFKYKIFDQELRENPSLVMFIDFIKILSVFGAFSILITCLGLLGMAMYSAENRVKEIGIRKVLGASVKNIVYLLSKEYLVLISISIAIGTPLAYLVNSLWLQEVTNKTELSPMIFVLGAGGTILLALFTVGTQALKAARTNSVQNLRSE